MPQPRPLVAITPDCASNVDHPTETTYVLRRNYADALTEAGAMPVILPYWLGDPADIVAVFDGFVISGSTPGIADMPGRTEFEARLIAAAIAADKPVLGICNGMQMIGRVLGGTMIERLPTPGPGAPDHIPQPHPTELAHDIVISDGSRLHGLASGSPVRVNSLHRQAIADDGDYLVAARASDGVVEAVEAVEGRGPTYVVGLQWHPEYRLTDFDRNILADFVSAMKTRR